jgi:hypothetical protein
MSYGDFIVLTPFEFTKVCEAWNGRQEALTRERWEQTRFLATASLIPHSKKRLKPTDVIRFAWDEKKQEKIKKPVKKSEREKFEGLSKKYG